MYKILTDHVEEIEREKEPVIKGFYADNAGMGMDSETFFREYTAELEKYLKSIRVKKDGMDTCPFTIIGSVVLLKDLEDSETMSCRIVLPFAHKSASDVYSASCMSPMGRALLLKPAGSKVTVKTPGGQIEYEIISICADDLDIGKSEILLYAVNPGIVPADA
jgi:transcription elongation factor GreA